MPSNLLVLLSMSCGESMTLSMASPRFLEGSRPLHNLNENMSGLHSLPSKKNCAAF